MFNPNFKYPDTEAYNFVVNRLHERGVELHQLSDIAFEMQSQFGEHSSREEYYENLIDVLHKRELLERSHGGVRIGSLSSRESNPRTLIVNYQK